MVEHVLLTQVFAVVRGQHHDRIVEHSPGLEGEHEPAKEVIQLGQGGVVESPEGIELALPLLA